MTDCDEGGEFDGTQDEPRYLLQAREAEMYQVGGCNLTADPQRAGSSPHNTPWSTVKPIVLGILHLLHITHSLCLDLICVSIVTHTSPTFLPSLQAICLQKPLKLPWRLWKAAWLTSTTWRLKRPGLLWKNNSGCTLVSENPSGVSNSRDTAWIVTVYISFFMTIVNGALYARVCVFSLPGSGFVSGFLSFLRLWSPSVLCLPFGQLNVVVWN